MQAIRTKLLLGILAFWLWHSEASASGFHIKGGTLVLEGRLVTPQLHVESDAWLRGNGTVSGDLLADGHIAPGGAVDQVGTQRVEGAATFNPGSRFYVYATDHETLDQLIVTGPVSGDCEVVTAAAPGAVPVDAIIIRGNAASGFSNFTPGNTWVWQTTTTGTVDLLLTHLRGDSDGNGLPDQWELRNFGLRTGADPHADADDDGYSNVSEYLANTDPNDDTSLLVFTRIERAVGETEVEWDTAAGRQYTLLYSTNAVDQPWVWQTSTVMHVYAQPSQVWTTRVDTANTIFGLRVNEYQP